MQSVARIALSVILLSSAVASEYHSGTKLRRDGVLNLYPFPRVGRASRQTWQVPINDYLLEPEPIKRQLYAFPRVGRTVPLHTELQPLQELLFKNHYVKRQGVVDSEAERDPGMWFGPRLGRGFRSEDDEVSQNDNDRDRSDPEQVMPSREKRQAKTT